MRTDILKAMFFVPVASMLAFSAAYAASSRPVYGNDDRVDLYAVTDPDIAAVADSVVSIYYSGHEPMISDGVAKMRLRPYTANIQGFKVGMCEDEKFASQPMAADCSGSLVAPDIVMTAGHCVSPDMCERTTIAFGFSIKQEGAIPTMLRASDVYSCKKVEAWKYSGPGTKDIDYSFIRLDRPVPDHKPLPLSIAPVMPGMPLTIIGHPSGLPLKVAPNAAVRSAVGLNGAFKSNTDSFQINSGSPVFSSITKEIVGMLVRGKGDYVIDSDKGCGRIVQLENEENWEDVESSTVLAPNLKLIGMGNISQPVAKDISEIKTIQ